MSDIVLAQPAQTSTSVAPLADCSPTQQIELRYMNAADALLADAAENDAPRVLADVLTWTLARIVDVYGMTAASDVIRRFGGHLGTLTEHRRARQEAEQAKEEGRAPH